MTCREMIRQGSRSFFAASLLLPQEVRRPAYALYAFCRLSDDAVDDPTSPEGRRLGLERLAARLDDVYAGTPQPHPVDRAFSDVVRAFAMPRALPEALLEGLTWDVEGRRYRTLPELRAYAARVAAAVGAMMTVLMGVRDPVVLARACDLGVAMQLTNICRDVGEDARMGRIYLPLDWLEEEGLDPDAFLDAPTFGPSLAGVVARLLAEAETLYRRAGTGIAGLPPSCRPAIQAARLIYREIGVDLGRRGHDSVSRRSVVSSRRKMALVGSAMAAALVPGRLSREPCLAETRFLVEAASAPVAVTSWRKLDDRVGWMIDLLGSLEQRHLETNPQPGPRRMPGAGA